MISAVIHDIISLFQVIIFLKIFVHLFQRFVSTVNPSLSPTRISNQDAWFRITGLDWTDLVCGFSSKLKNTTTRQQIIKTLQHTAANTKPCKSTQQTVIVVHCPTWRVVLRTFVLIKTYCKALNYPLCSSSTWYGSLLPAHMQTSVWPAVHFPPGVRVVISTCPGIITAAHGKKAPRVKFPVYYL